MMLTIAITAMMLGTMAASSADVCDAGEMLPLLRGGAQRSPRRRERHSQR
jgi:hypothetical protein